MASSSAIWGIDLGQCALKALRCRPHPDDPTKIQAEAFDYIEYPKLLNQPEADTAELIREALTEFLSRNVVKGDRIAIAVPGQSGLARFIKLPPVESKKIPDIVKYEARQQIPFPLHDVVWDYQRMAGGAEEEGFALETEVGLFAMKRDQVFRALKPFDDARVEIDVVQLTPLSLFNFAVFDQMKGLPSPEDFDPENPPESVVVLSIGTETSDLVVTNGFRVWQRSIPLGGSHFTRSLSKELKLTFAKAEHLKRNARQTSQDPKVIFRAMRPVFNDLLTEVQRSIGYFSSIDRHAKINRVLALGNAVKLPGLTRFIAQNLGYEVIKPEQYEKLAGRSVTAAPQFKDNLLSFATCYGLCVQALAPARVRTNLMPPEVLLDRTIRNKKPWAMAAAAAVLVGLTVNFFGHWRVWNSVQENYAEGGKSFREAVSAAQLITRSAGDFRSKTDDAKKAYAKADAYARDLTRAARYETQWLEVYKAIEAALPRDTSPAADPADASLKISERRELHIEGIECTKVADLAAWFARVAHNPPFLAPEKKAGEGDGEPKPPTPPPSPPGEAAGPTPVVGPKGEGWVFRLRGYHYFNSDPRTFGQTFVLDTLVDAINKGELTVAAPPGHPSPELSLKEVGLGFAVLIDPQRINETFEIDNPEYRGGKAGEKDKAPAKLKAPRFDFEVQFAWQPRQDVPADPKAGANQAAASDATRR